MKKLLILLVTSLLSTSVNGQGFSLVDILGAPYCSHLVASKNRNQISWVVNKKGIRTLYSAQAPEFVPVIRYVSPYDDGQVIGNIFFSHAEDALFYVKGSGSNMAGEIANPSSEASYPIRQLYRVNLANNITDTIGAYNNYVISPCDEFLLAFTGSKLHSIDLRNKSEALLVKMRGTFADVSFSPDGQSILFVSNRGDHSFIGQFHFGARQIQWIAPSVYLDQSPVWSPDGDRIAFIRAPGNRNGELRNITGGNRFSLMIHDLRRHETIEAWTSPADDGGFAQYYHQDPLRWASTGHLLFYSEHEGWMKIYSLHPITGKLKDVLAGDCEIEHSDLSNNGQQLVFSSNCGDLDRRDLFVYDIAKESTQQVTNSDDLESDPILLHADEILYRKASYNVPTTIAHKSSAGERLIYETTDDPTFPKFDLVVPKQVIFQAADGTKVHGQLFVKGETGQKPGLLFMHGGPIRQMLLGYHYSSYYANAYALNQYLANRGFAVMSVNYRAGIGYGKTFRRAEGQGPRGASEYQDILAAAQYLQYLPYVDQNRIGLWGGSYGGLLTAQGLARNSDLFKVGVDFHGVHDWSWRATNFSPGGGWGITKDLLEKAFQSSPVAEIEAWKSPVLLIHGDDDRNVMFGQTVDLVERLRAQNIYHEILILPDEVHGFYRYDSWLRSYEATTEFFEKFLMK